MSENLSPSPEVQSICGTFIVTIVKINSSAICRRVTWYKGTDVSEERATRLFTLIDLTCRETEHAPPKPGIARSVR